MVSEREAVVERRVAKLREQVERLVAELHGAQEELKAIRTGRGPVQSLTSLERKEAILAVLRSVDVNLSPSEIRERLIESGRSDELKEVTATLSYLLGKGDVWRPARGSYLAV